MPVADFPGQRNWGYDGVFPFAPDSVYGRPEDLKELVQSAHSRGIMVLLDVVYNHFGPEGNYLGVYAPQFFTGRHHTPWGNAINFDGPGSRTVRDFFIHNALYWLTEYHFDGLRLDAVHAIIDDSDAPHPHRIGRSSSQFRRAGSPHSSRSGKRTQPGALSPKKRALPAAYYTAQWNDDIHHAVHVLITGERDGYYSDYAERPLESVGPLPGRGIRLPGRGFALTGTARRVVNPPPACRPLHLSPSCRITIRSETVRSANVSPKIADPRAVRASVAILSACPVPTVALHGRRVWSGNAISLFLRF